MGNTIAGNAQATPSADEMPPPPRGRWQVIQLSHDDQHRFRRPESALAVRSEYGEGVVACHQAIYRRQTA
jgi:hypothetical protein